MNFSNCLFLFIPEIFIKKYIYSILCNAKKHFRLAKESREYLRDPLILM